MPRFINAKLKSDSDLDSESEYDSMLILLTFNKLKLNSCFADFEQVKIVIVLALNNLKT